jgi:pyruvate-formate lyase-activating enzyme
VANKDIFCNVPWFHLHLNHDGGFGLCCVQQRDPQPNPYNIHTHSIAEWYQGTVMTRYRQQMLGDTPMSVCTGCYKDEEFDNESYRLSQNWRSVIFTKQAFTESFKQSPHNELFREDGSYDGMPLDMHIDMGNECNLACKFCHPEFSSQIASKYKKWGIYDQDEVLRRNWMTDDGVWDRFLKELLTIKNLQSVHFMGGEPTLSPRLEQFFDFFIQHGKTDFAVSFVTNGTRYRPELLEKMLKFKRVDLDISIESILDNNYYMRQGLDKELFTKNVKLYLSHRRENFAVCLKPVISALTAPTFPELIEFFLDNNIMMESNICWDPAYLQIATLPIDIRKGYLPKFENLLARLENLIGHTNTDMVRSRTEEKNVLNLYSELDTVYKMLQAPEPDNADELRKQLIYWLDKWDRELDLDARDHYPEWTDFLNAYDYKKA